MHYRSPGQRRELRRPQVVIELSALDDEVVAVRFVNSLP